MKYIIISALLVGGVTGCSNIQVKVKAPSGEDGPVVGEVTAVAPVGHNVSADSGIDPKSKKPKEK